MVQQQIVCGTFVFANIPEMIASLECFFVYVILYYAYAWRKSKLKNQTLFSTVGSYVVVQDWIWCFLLLQTEKLTIIDCDQHNFVCWFIWLLLIYFYIYSMLMDSVIAYFLLYVSFTFTWSLYGYFYLMFCRFQYVFQSEILFWISSCFHL